MITNDGTRLGHFGSLELHEYKIDPPNYALKVSLAIPSIQRGGMVGRYYILNRGDTFTWDLQFKIIFLENVGKDLYEVIGKLKK